MLEYLRERRDGRLRIMKCATVECIDEITPLMNGYQCR